MTLNEDLIRSRCQEIRDTVTRLGPIADHPREHFLEDRDAQDIVSYRLLVAIEAALALCYHLAARRVRKTPEEYAECFEILGGAGLIPESLSVRLQQMARFRNLLVHRYALLDYGRVHDTLRQDLDDLCAFCATVIELV